MPYKDQEKRKTYAREYAAIKRAEDKAENFATVSAQVKSVGDPNLVEWFGLNNFGLAPPNEMNTLGITTVWAAVKLISNAIGQLPLKTYDESSGIKIPVDTFLDKPAGPFPVGQMMWKKLIMLHLLLHGETFLEHIFSNDGTLIGLWPINPLAVSRVRWNNYDKVFTVMMTKGGRVDYGTPSTPLYDANGNPLVISQIIDVTTEGLRGISPIAAFRRSLETTRAGEIAANRSFQNGLLKGGLVTTSENIPEPEAQQMLDDIKNKATGAENAGGILFYNRALNFTPWTMSQIDAQFIESRKFQIDEIARIYQIPSHMINANEKNTSWGTGIKEQNLGLQKYTLQPWTTLIEETVTDILDDGLSAEFDWKGFLQADPQT